MHGTDDNQGIRSRRSKIYKRPWSTLVAMPKADIRWREPSAWPVCLLHAVCVPGVKDTWMHAAS